MLPRTFNTSLHHRKRILFGQFLIILCVAGFNSGCFAERSFPFRPDRITVLPASQQPETTRQWLRRAHETFMHKLDDDDEELALLTEDMLNADGKPIDVMTHFDRDDKILHSVFDNLRGLQHTAQVTGTSESVEEPAPPWDGFEDIWIPIDEGIQIQARLGLARDAAGQPKNANCIILLPGLLGDNMRLRSRDIASGLRDYGFHAISLELRGHGQTEAKHPDLPYNFGVLETADLLVVDEWLRQKPYVKKTGIIGFSWSANSALLAPYEDGRPLDDPLVAPEIRAAMPPIDRTQRHFEAGAVALSPCLKFEKICDGLEEDHDYVVNPVYHSLQSTVNLRATRKGYPPMNGSLRALIAHEFSRSVLNHPNAVADGYTYLRLSPYKDKPFRSKLEHARVPVLIVHGSNDPLAYANEVAEFFSFTKNPNVAGVILNEGGHDGFAAYRRDYIYSIIVNFFSDERGPDALAPSRSDDNYLNKPTLDKNRTSIPMS